MKTIRGVRIIHWRREKPPPEESLRYSLDVCDERENYVECLGRVAEGARDPRERPSGE